MAPVRALACRTMKQRVLVASNRGPVSYQFGADGSLTGRRGGGGMIAGVTAGLAALGPEADVTWICAALSDADRAAAARQRGRPRGGRPRPGRHPVRMLDIPPDIFDRAYNHVANSALWFVHHLLFDTPNQPQFGREFRRDWESYLAYNEAFAAALMADEALPEPEPRRGVARADPGLPPEPGAADAAGQARRGGRDVGIAHFCHTPWAPPDYYRMLPEQVGRACSTASSARTRRVSTPSGGPSRSCSAAPPCWAPTVAGPRAPGRWRVTYRGHVTEVAVHPLGVDAPALRERARAEDVQRARQHAQRGGGGPEADRQGRPDRAVQEHRPRPGRVSRAARDPAASGGAASSTWPSPTRPGPRWRSTAPTPTGCGRLAREITEEFGTADWNPLILEVKDDYPRSLAACAVADVLLVNPVRDGMNLVAQEGPVLSERGCALVLSREAGAAATLAADALLVNPYDITETADGPAPGARHARRRTPAPQRRAGRHRRRGPARALAGRPARLAGIGYLGVRSGSFGSKRSFTGRGVVPRGCRSERSRYAPGRPAPASAGRAQRAGWGSAVTGSAGATACAAGGPAGRAAA